MLFLFSRSKNCFIFTTTTTTKFISWKHRFISTKFTIHSYSTHLDYNQRSSCVYVWFTGRYHKLLWALSNLNIQFQWFFLKKFRFVQAGKWSTYIYVIEVEWNVGIKSFDRNKSSSFVNEFRKQWNWLFLLVS